MLKNLTKSDYNPSYHVSEDLLLPENKQCPFCGDGQNRELGMLQEDPKVSLRKCGSCHAAWASRFPVEEALKDYYRNYYLELNRGTTINPVRLARHLHRYLAPEIDPKRKTLSMLDFGGGDGGVSYHLAAQLRSAGVETIRIDVIDRGSKIIEPEDGSITIAYHQGLEEIDAASRYDIVIASAVLEHVVESAATTSSLLEKIAPGGLFYARTPHLEGFFRVFDKLGWRLDFNYPGHLYDLGGRFWIDIVKTLGFDGRLEILRSRTSIVESQFHESFIRTLIAYLCKFPALFIGERYPFAGGWEIFLKSSER